MIMFLTGLMKDPSVKKFYQNQVLDLKFRKLEKYTDLSKIKLMFESATHVNDPYFDTDSLHDAVFYILRSTCDDDIHKAITHVQQTQIQLLPPPLATHTSLHGARRPARRPPGGRIGQTGRSERAQTGGHDRHLFYSVSPRLRCVSERLRRLWGVSSARGEGWARHRTPFLARHFLSPPRRCRGRRGAAHRAATDGARRRRISGRLA